MNSIRPSLKTTVAFALAALIGITPAMAEKPVNAGGGNGNGKPQYQERGPNKVDKRDNDRKAQGDGRSRKDDAGNRAERRDDDGMDRGDRRDPREVRSSQNGRSDGLRVSAYFSPEHREVVRRYYSDRYRANDCPPGLAKKRNGCLPPGIAKKWRIGQPLPRDLVYYDAPAEIVIRLGAPPEMHRYVRVGADILLIAIGTGMVIDAIEDLNRF